MEKSKFQIDLEKLINRYSLEKDSDTPDFILAEYLNNCLKNFNNTIKMRDDYWGDDHSESFLL